jgi:integrase
MAKRGNNEGSICKRSDGRYQAAITIGYDQETGKQKRQFFYGKTRTEVAQKLKDAINLKDKGIIIEPTKLTTGELVEHWLDTYGKSAIRESTYLRYRTALKCHINPAIGHIPLKDLKPDHIQRMYNLLSESMSHSTVSNAHTLLKQAIAHAVQQSYIVRNVIDTISIPKSRKKDISVWTIEQFNSFLASIRKHKLYPLFLLEYGTGMRRSELLAIRWADIDLTNSVVTVRKSLSRGVDHRFVIADTKTAKGVRQIPLPAKVTAELKAHKARQNEVKLMSGPAYTDNDLVFCLSDGSIMDPGNLNRIFGRMQSKTALPRIRFHDLRHSHATMLLLLGEHPKVVQERLGHSSITMTLDTYSHLIPGMQSKASSKLNDVLDTDDKSRSK